MHFYPKNEDWHKKLGCAKKDATKVQLFNRMFGTTAQS
jgi:hypothetical protein